MAWCRPPRSEPGRPVTVCHALPQAKGPLKVRLTRKLANSLDGVDVSRAKVGDVLDVPEREATMLISEGWATRVLPDAPDARAKGSEGRRSRRKRQES
jgi:hypothetical protein